MREKQQRFAYFDKSAFDKGIHSTMFKNAPAGLLYPGDPGIPDNTTFGPNYYLKRFVPRLGLAWDPKGDGQMTVRGSYGLFWDYPHMYAYGDTRDEPPFGGQVTVPSLLAVCRIRGWDIQAEIRFHFSSVRMQTFRHPATTIGRRQRAWAV